VVKRTDSMTGWGMDLQFACKVINPSDRAQSSTGGATASTDSGGSGAGARELSEAERRGRVSGSVAWRAARRETGKTKDIADASAEDSTSPSSPPSSAPLTVVQEDAEGVSASRQQEGNPKEKTAEQKQDQFKVPRGQP
jgi:hypothetical protein